MMMRNHTFSRILLAGSLVLPVAQFAFGQQPRAGFGQPAQPGFRQGNDLSGRSGATGAINGQVPGNQILRGSQIIGATVDLRGGSRFGTISDFVLGDGGCVDYVVATYQGQYVPIPWASAIYQPGQRVLMVDIDAARIREIPMFRSFSELSNRQFSDKVHTFYRGVQGRAGDMNQRGAAGQQRANSNAQPATGTAPGRAAGTTQGGGNTASKKGGERR